MRPETLERREEFDRLVSAYGIPLKEESEELDGYCFSQILYQRCGKVRDFLLIIPVKLSEVIYLNDWDYCQMSSWVLVKSCVILSSKPFEKLYHHRTRQSIHSPDITCP